MAPCPSSLWVALSLRHGSTLAGPRQNYFSPPLLFNLLVDSLAATFRSAIPGVPLIASAPFRHVCQHCADDLVILTASQADLQAALDAVHDWGVRWRFSLGVGPTKSATIVLCAIALAAVYILAASPCPWSISAGTWVLFSLSHPFLAPSRRLSLLSRRSSLSPGQMLVPW